MTEIVETRALTRAERHVTEGEAWMARQAYLVEKLTIGNNQRAIERARRAQASLRTLLDLAHLRLRDERAALGINP